MRTDDEERRSEYRFSADINLNILEAGLELLFGVSLLVDSVDTELETEIAHRRLSLV